VRKKIVVFILLVIMMLVGFCYGYFVHRNKIFPYNIIRKAQMSNLYRMNMQWSIGVYAGPTPFDLTDTDEIENPVISASDVSDVDAAFVADPFIIENGGKYFMFFEVLNMDSYTGDIGYAVSDDGKSWDYRKIVLDEAFHMSYPCVYFWQGNYYMIPESSEDLSVRLYKATSFPEEWTYVGNLLSGSQYFDPTAFFHDNKWWMFASGKGDNVLNLFSSDSLISGWLPHPMNPVIDNNKHLARSAGRVFEYDNRLYRLAQDDYPSYGIQVFAIEIRELSALTYKENADSAIQVVTMSNKGWNAAGMHQVDFFKMDNKWYAVVDGLKRRP
jgi:hypothetical protein